MKNVFTSRTLAASRQVWSLGVAMLLTQAAVAQSAAPTDLFSPAQEVRMGLSSVGVALADIDHDGNLDMLSISENSNVVLVRRSMGHGAFGTADTNAEPVLVGRGVSALAVADVNGDATPDLLTTNSTDHSVSVCYNDGQGHFFKSVTVPVTEFPSQLTLADIDGDGDLDLLASSSATTFVSLRLNDGHGLFQAPATGAELAIDVTSNAMAMCDVDQDGDLDLLLASQTGRSVVMAQNLGQGAFGAVRLVVGLPGGPTGLALGDVTGDGLPDLAVSLANEARVSIHRNQGAGSFEKTGQRLPVGGNPGSLALSDVNRDGTLDVLVANRLSATVSLCLNNGGGAFALSDFHVIQVGVRPEQLVLADVDGDGHADLITANRLSGAPTICLRQTEESAVKLAGATAIR